MSKPNGNDDSGVRPVKRIALEHLTRRQCTELIVTLEQELTQTRTLLQETRVQYDGMFKIFVAVVEQWWQERRAFILWRRLRVKPDPVPTIRVPTAITERPLDGRVLRFRLINEQVVISVEIDTPDLKTDETPVPEIHA